MLTSSSFTLSTTSSGTRSKCSAFLLCFREIHHHADPLDTIKVRMQLSRSSRGKGVSFFRSIRLTGPVVVVVVKITCSAFRPGAYPLFFLPLSFLLVMGLDKSSRIHRDGSFYRQEGISSWTLQGIGSGRFWNRSENGHPVRQFRNLQGLLGGSCHWSS